MMAKMIPEIDANLCNLCGDCVQACPQSAVTMHRNRLELDEARCAYCGDCEDLCPMGAIALPYEIIVVESPPAALSSANEASTEE
jgi:formate hydrogenlyase subunit 6/NADH:ubiquinone oxidoreductase subunit I